MTLDVPAGRIGLLKSKMYSLAWMVSYLTEEKINLESNWIKFEIISFKLKNKSSEDEKSKRIKTTFLT